MNVMKFAQKVGLEKIKTSLRMLMMMLFITLMSGLITLVVSMVIAQISSLLGITIHILIID